MSIKLTPLRTGFAARLDGVDAAHVSDADVAVVRKASSEYPVLVLPDQHMEREEQLAFATKFGPIDVNELAPKYNKADVPPEFAEPSRNSSAQRQDERLLLYELSNSIWHTDSSYKTVPAHLSMLYCLKATREGGETQYADLRVAYETLPPKLRTLVEDMVAEHGSMQKRILFGYEHTPEERETFKPVSAYDLVRTLPETRRKTLYLSGHATRIFGLSYSESRLFLNELMEHATTQDNVYTHKWTQNDFVIWDDRCTMHRLRRYDVATEDRHMRRVATRDDAFPSRDLAALVKQYAA